MSLFHITKHKLFFRFVLPYILVLIIPLFTGYVIYHRTLSLMEEEVTQNNFSILEQSKSTLNSRLEEIDVFAQKLVSDPKVIQFQHSETSVSGTNMGSIMDMIKKLADYKPVNQFIFDYYVMYKNSQMVLSNNTVYGLWEFYDTVQRRDQVDYVSWFQESLGVYYYHKVFPARTVQFRGEKKSFVTYIRSLGYPNYYQGAAVILIEEQRIKDLLRGLDVSGGGWAYIANDKGEQITRLSGQEVPQSVVDLPDKQNNGIFHQTIEGQDMLVTFTKSGYNNWTYVAVQPEHIILEKAHYIREFTFTLFIISLIIGGLVSFVLAYRGSKPVGRLIGTVKELRDKMDAQLPFLQAALLERLLRSGFVHEADLQAASAHAGLRLDARYYAVAIVQLGGYDNQISPDILAELALKRMLVREGLAREFADLIYFHESKEDQLILLLMCDQETPAPCKTESAGKLQSIAVQLRSEVKNEIRIALGSFYGQRMDVSRSYEEAQQVLNSFEMNGKGELLTYEDIPSSISQYFFPGETETRLVNMTKAGESGQVERLLAELEKENFIQRHLSLDMLRLFVHEIWAALVKTAGELPQKEDGENAQLKETIKRMETYVNCHEAFDCLRQEFLQACARVNGSKKSHNTQLLGQLLELIHDSLSSESLTLSQIAGSLQFSEVYLSQFFKEQTGETFTAYLERIRMERALELLKETEIAIKDIAGMVGYGSSNTFGRAFKRVYGTNATTIRMAKKPDPFT